MNKFTSKKFIGYGLAFVSGTLMLGITPEAQAVSASATGAGFSIPDDDPVGVFSDVTIIDSFAIEDVTVTLTDLDHTFTGDLIATLTNLGTGTSVTLFDRPGVPAGTFGNGGDLSGTFRFNDSFTGDFVAASTADVNGGDFFTTAADDSQTFLSDFDGESSANTFRLFISDNAFDDVGSLGSFTLELSGPATAVPFEFSPTLGLVLLSGGIGLMKGRERLKKQNSKVDLG